MRVRTSLALLLVALTLVGVGFLTDSNERTPRSQGAEGAKGAEKRLRSTSQLTEVQGRSSPETTAQETLSDQSRPAEVAIAFHIDPKLGQVPIFAKRLVDNTTNRIIPHSLEGGIHYASVSVEPGESVFLSYKSGLSSDVRWIRRRESGRILTSTSKGELNPDATVVVHVYASWAMRVVCHGESNEPVAGKISVKSRSAGAIRRELQLETEGDALVNDLDDLEYLVYFAPNAGSDYVSSRLIVRPRTNGGADFIGHTEFVQFKCRKRVSTRISFHSKSDDSKEIVNIEVLDAKRTVCAARSGKFKNGEMLPQIEFGPGVGVRIRWQKRGFETTTRELTVEEYISAETVVLMPGLPLVPIELQVLDGTDHPVANMKFEVTVIYDVPSRFFVISDEKGRVRIPGTDAPQFYVRPESAGVQPQHVVNPSSGFQFTYYREQVETVASVKDSRVIRGGMAPYSVSVGFRLACAPGTALPLWQAAANFNDAHDMMTIRIGKDVSDVHAVGIRGLLSALKEGGSLSTAWLIFEVDTFPVHSITAIEALESTWNVDLGSFRGRRPVKVGYASLEGVGPWKILPGRVDYAKLLSLTSGLPGCTLPLSESVAKADSQNGSVSIAAYPNTDWFTVVASDGTVSYCSSNWNSANSCSIEVKSTNPGARLEVDANAVDSFVVTSEFYEKLDVDGKGGREVHYWSDYISVPKQGTKSVTLGVFSGIPLLVLGLKNSYELYSPSTSLAEHVIIPRKNALSKASLLPY